jgi:hypothetical protein
MVHTLVYARQRRALRRAVPVECQVVRERDFRMIATRGVDLSPDGMLVVAQAPVLTGEPVIVSFRLPRSGGWGWWFDAEATIARVVHGRRPGDRGRRLGLAFDGLDEGVRMFMENALRGTPPPVPARAPRIDYAASVRLAAMS